MYIRIGIASILVLSGTSGSVASSATIMIEPADDCTELASVSWEVGGTPIEIQARDGKYVFTEPAPPAEGKGLEYTIVASWKDPSGEEQSIQIYLKSPADSNLELTVFSKHMPQTTSALNALLRSGTDFKSTMRKHQLARDLYRRMWSQDTALRRAALKAWLDSAYQLSHKYAFMAPDQEVIELAQNSKDPYLKSMSTQYSLLPWRDARQIREAVRSNDIDRAKKLNASFLEDLLSLSPDRQKDIQTYYGINIDLLKANTAYLEATKGNS
ncbi:MAG: hypothetical protein J0H11_08740 [Rhizobiales bacterium]|nr:hypothetical protein [Hyphomicrobiales bacterium]